MVLLLGRDHPAHGGYTARTLRSGETACALSAGASPPGGRTGKPNEDALLAIEEGSRTLLAVSDAHFGPETSHDLLRRIAGRPAPLPTNPLALFELLLARPSPAGPAESAFSSSETTLVVAVLDHETRRGFGISYGDSSLMVLSLEDGPRRVNSKNRVYVQPCVPSSLDPRRADEFAFRTRPGDLVIAFTDGIDECHYRRPATSIQPAHLESLQIRSGSDPERFVRSTLELALTGVSGHPGGQDNIALIATRV
jgi:hypothetical protein